MHQPGDQPAAWLPAPSAGDWQPLGSFKGRRHDRLNDRDVYARAEAKGYFVRQLVKKFDGLTPPAPPGTGEIYLFHVESGMRIYELYAKLDDGAVGKGKGSL